MFAAVLTTWRRCAPLIALAAVFIAAAALPPAVQAGPMGGKGGDMKHFGELTKDTEHLTGFFDVYVDKETVYLEIPVDRIEDPFLLISSLSRGIGMAGLLGGTSLNIFEAEMLQFVRRGDRLLLLSKSQSFRGPEGSAVASAVDLSFGHSVLASLDIVSERHEGDEVGVVPEKKEDKKEKKGGDGDEAESEDEDAEGEGDETEGGDEPAEDLASAEETGTGDAEAEAEEEEEEEEPEKPVVSVVVKFSDYIMTDIPNLGRSINRRFEGGGFSLDKNRSSFEGVKVFPDNAEFEVNLVFKSGGKRYVETLNDSRSLPLGVHYSFSRLPEEPMMPRLADDRVGYFLTVHKDFSRDRESDFFVRYINRWRLEKKNPNRDVSDPVKPIVYYVENTIPEEYRQYVKEGIEMWQPAFEAAGFSNAIVGRMQPDDPDFDAEDVRYSTIRWITSHQRSFGAIGPSRVDPRTGEILDADILMEGGMIQGFKSSWRGYVGLGAEEGIFPWEYVERAEAEAFLAALESPDGINSGAFCGLGVGLVEAGALLQTALVARGDIKPGEPVPDKFVGEAIRWVVAHEVGHTLGLRHNFKSSSSCPYDKLNDKSWTRKNGLIGSVMDYPTTNIATNGKPQGDYFSQAAGTYDHWAIRYGYTPVKGAKNPDAELKALAAIAEESSDPLHAYGTDEDAYLPGSVDPFTNTWDLSDDVLAFAEDRSQYLASLWGNGYDERIVADGRPWSEFTNNFAVLLGGYYRTMVLAARQIGSQVTSRAHKGDPGASLPLTATGADDQRRALRLIAGSMFSETPFDMPADFYRKLGSNNLSHWGASTHRGLRRDFPYHEAVLSLQRGVLGRLTNAWTLAKVADAELQAQTDPFTLVELIETLNGAIWSEVGVGAGSRAAGAGGASAELRNIPSLRRGLQRDWLDRLSDMALSEGRGPLADARSVARMTLTDLQAGLESALERADGLDGYTRAHLMESRDTAARVLEAGLIQNAGGE